MMPILRVDRRRALGDKRFLLLATLFPIVFILVTGLISGRPERTCTSAWSSRHIVSSTWPSGPAI